MFTLKLPLELIAVTSVRNLGKIVSLKVRYLLTTEAIFKKVAKS